METVCLHDSLRVEGLYLAMVSCTLLHRATQLGGVEMTAEEKEAILLQREEAQFVYDVRKKYSVECVKGGGGDPAERVRERGSRCEHVGCL